MCIEHQCTDSQSIVTVTIIIVTDRRTCGCSEELLWVV